MNFKNFIIMSIFSWILFGCESVPEEKDYFGFDLPITSTHNYTALTYSNEKTKPFFKDNLDDSWQIVVHDSTTGKPIFEKTLNHLESHRITQVLCQDEKVYVDISVVYHINPFGVTREYYKDYTVAFDLKTAKPLWRTNFTKH